MNRESLSVILHRGNSQRDREFWRFFLLEFIDRIKLPFQQSQSDRFDKRYERGNERFVVLKGEDEMRSLYVCVSGIYLEESIALNF